MATEGQRAKYEERHALLCLQGWDGYSETPVVVVGATPTKFRIRALDRTKLGGRSRWLYRGETALVPKHAIKFDAST